LLASLNILAFLVHTVLEWFDQCYALVRNGLSSRKTFFDDIRALTRYMQFDSWQSLLKFMLEGLEVPAQQQAQQQHSSAGSEYDRAYSACLNGRGYTVR
jgi:hypothetical protein